MAGRITFLRHAESAANAGLKTASNAEGPLSDKGYSQAAAFAERLKAQPPDVRSQGAGVERRAAQGQAAVRLQHHHVEIGRQGSEAIGDALIGRAQEQGLHAATLARRQAAAMAHI